MPIYEYRCSSCGHELDALQKFSDAPLTTCPSCHAEALVKQLSAAGFQLKGSGWYATDFKSGGAKPAPSTTEGAAAADSATGKDAAAKGDSKSDSKGDSKADAAPPKSDSKTDSSGSATAPAAKTGATPAAT